MPILKCYISDDNLRHLRIMASERGREAEDLAEAAIENAILEALPRGRRGYDCNNTESAGGDPSPF
ncbi:MAG: hypothetical protein KIT48_09320 [Pseudolabrys sp.]|nr:hypothetical protein [Pseudolabrys sp.]